MALPGVQAVIKDEFYNLQQTNIPAGPRLLIIGRRNDGGDTSLVPDLDPYFATREENVILAFGQDSELHRGFKEASAGGASRIYLVALPEDTVFDYDTGDITSTTYDSSTPGDTSLFDAAFAAAEVVRPDVIVPYGTGSDSTIWESPATPGNDPDDYGFYADNDTTAPILDNDGEVTTESPSFAWKVARKCFEITRDSYPVFGVMGVKPYVGLTENMTPAETASHLTLPNLIDREDMGEFGRYLVVIASEIRPIGYAATAYSNGAAILAADILGRDEWNSPTNQTIFNITAMRYTPSKSTQLSLIEKAVVPAAVGYNRIPTWIDVMTNSPVGSDYARLTTLRIVFASIQVVRGAARPFIGQAATLDARNALETQVVAGLRSMQQQGALYASTPSFTYIASTNEVIIDLVLVPAFELRNVEVRVSVNLGNAAA